jgi:serine/threonine-protein kinase HipA
MSKKSKVTSPFKPVGKLEVWVWGQRVGVLALDPKLGFYVFAYDPKFTQTRIELSPLQMPIQHVDPFVFTDLPLNTYYRLPAMLADALPDDFGNALIDRYMAERGLAKSQITALDRLAYMGKRAMGALEFKPAQGPSAEKPTAIILSELVSEARSLLHGKLARARSKMFLQHILAVGSSAGGARAKAVIAWNEKTNQMLPGQGECPEGYEHWLLKFDGVGIDRDLGDSQEYGRTEYAYYWMARQAGIEMSPCMLWEENGRAHFMTQRFDREKDGVKHHLQTLCAMSHLDFKKRATHSYESLFLTIKQLKLPRAAELQAFRRMVFNVLACNCDDHTKNISFRLQQGRGWELAPAYDLTFAFNPLGEWTDQHLMSVNGKFKEIQKKDFLSIAERFGIGEAPQLIKEVQQSIAHWPQFAKKAGLSKSRTERIWKTLKASK